MLERTQFQKILAAARCGQPALLRVDVAGRTYLRPFQPAERLLILGGGHVAQPLCRLAAALGYAVTVADDRPEFVTPERFQTAAARIPAAFPDAIAQFRVGAGDYVAILTRGHAWDAQCLRAVLSGTMPRYLGMMGSRRRVRAQRELLAQEGFPADRLAALHAPIGLPIGALTPQEIAVSIAAELIQTRRADAQAACQTDADLRLLETLCDQTPRAALLVVQTEGSTPAKTGALMTVDETGTTAGTIGGGASEFAAIQAARALIGTGETRLLPLNLGGSVAADGMACGGRTTVLLADLQ